MITRPSAESGLATFRDPHTGLWERFRPEDLATPTAWEADPALVWAWYLWRFERIHTVAPNPGHLALAQWEHLDLAQVTIVTQNVDDLHERAGSGTVHHLHGSIGAFRCGACALPYSDPVPVPEEPVERISPPVCSACLGLVRPGVVWFGEALPTDPWEAAVIACEEADLVLSVGTSGIVYPAAGLLDYYGGNRLALVNRTGTGRDDLANLVVRASIGEVFSRL